MDYASLRQEGIRLLARMAGGEWTDFNVHDPGITLLEQLCYALTDLGYRIAHSLPDLLASGGGDPYASLHPPAAILSAHAVTGDDLRRLILDVEGVKNAWVEPAGGSAADLPALYYLPEKKELRLSAQGISAPALSLRGLHRITIEASGALEDAVIKAAVAARLYEHRSLGQDFTEIRVLTRQPVQVEATLEVAPVDDPGALLAALHQALAEELSPSVSFSSLEQLIDAGLPVEEIFSGPRLTHGFLTAEALEKSTRRTVIHTSDLLHLLMGMPGVRAVNRIRVSKGGTWQEWSLPIDPDKVPFLDVAGSRLTLRRAGKSIAAKLPERAEAAAGGGASRPRGGGLSPPAGRDRHVGKYSSVQQHLPMLYGVGEAGLPDAATPARKAQAKQLRAYLLFFDQILANAFAQLAEVKDLFSFSSRGQTYFTQAFAQPGLGLDALRGLDDTHRRDLQELVEIPDSAAAWERRNRFLNHLLARFAEPIGDHAVEATLAERAARKAALLRDYPRCSSARGTGRDCLRSEDQRSGLEDRLRLQLGLSAESGEALVAVEHTLLRPIKEDWLPALAGEWEEPPLLAAAPTPDLYSLQLSWVLPDGVGRFGNPAFKQLVEQTLRAETPAHLVLSVRWLQPAAWAEFAAAYSHWLVVQRAQLAEKMNISQQDSPALARPTRSIDLRAARDRIIDLLGIAETYPLRDIRFTAQSPIVVVGGTVSFVIDPSQRNVRYELYEGGSAVLPPCTLDGTGGPVVLAGPRITTDHTFRIRAVKIDRPERQTFLSQQSIVRVGLNSALSASLPGLDPAAPLVDYGSSVEVALQSSQAGVTYRLLDPAGREVSAAPVIGNGGQRSLFTQPMYEDTVLHIRANRDFDAVENRPALQIFLDVQLPLAVRANPELAVNVAGSAVCDYANTALLNLEGSQQSVVYSVYVRALADRDVLVQAPPEAAALLVQVPGGTAVQVARPPRPDGWQVQPGYALRAQAPGNGGALQIPITSLTEDCVVVLRAHKDHSAVAAESDLQLRAAAAILVRPAPVPGLALERLPGDNSVSVLVTGGQPGVFYSFFYGTPAVSLGLPAYFHKLDDQDPALQRNRGLELLRIGADLVIARDPPPAAAGAAPELSHRSPLPPIVVLTAWPPDGAVAVMAKKARTGVTWLAPGAATITLPNPTP